MSGDDFARTVARIAVAQICDSVGFNSIQGSALESLADIAIRYLKDVAAAAHHYTNMSGRVDTSVYDMIQALEDVGGNMGMACVDPSRSVASSNAIREVMRYVQYGGSEVPFPKPIPRFPVQKKRSVPPSFAQLDEAPKAHIPLWLPAHPDAHTYRSTPVWGERNGNGKRDAAATRLEQGKQRRKAEKSLISLHARLAETNSEMEAEDEAPDADGNAFLLPPVDVTATPSVPVPRVPSPPPKLLDIFAPALDTVLELQETEHNGRTAHAALPDAKDRPKVVFHLEHAGKMQKQADQAAAVLGVGAGAGSRNQHQQQQQDQHMRDAAVN